MNTFTETDERDDYYNRDKNPNYKFILWAMIAFSITIAILSALQHLNK